MASTRRVRWERLFDDLEAQLRSDETRELVAEVADRTRRERALVGLHERFAAAADRTVVEIRVAGVGLLRGLVTGSGPDWVLLDHRVEASADASSRDGCRFRHVDRPVLVATEAIRSVTGLGGAEQTGAVGQGVRVGVRPASGEPRPGRRRSSSTSTGSRPDGDHRQRRARTTSRSPSTPPTCRAGPRTCIAVRAVPFAGVAMVRRR